MSVRRYISMLCWICSELRENRASHMLPDSMIDEEKIEKLSEGS